MSSYPKAAKDGTEFLRSYWIQIKETEKTHECLVSLHGILTARKGVIVWVLEAIGPVDGFEHLLTLGSVQAEYPNAYAKGLEAFLFTLSIKLDKVVEDNRGDKRRTPTLL